MMKKTIFLILTLCVGLISSSLISCKKDKGNNPAGTKAVKYELSGNYTGHIFVAFTDQNGGTTNEIVSVLPWTKEINAPVSIIAVAMGGQTSAPNYGVNGQTVTAKLYVAGQVKQSGMATADANGALTLPNLSGRLQ